MLSDPEQRQVYDRYGQDGLRQGGFPPGGGAGFGSIEDIFSGAVFGGAFGFEVRRGPMRGQDLMHAVEITAVAGDARGERSRSPATRASARSSCPPASSTAPSSPCAATACPAPTVALPATCASSST